MWKGKRVNFRRIIKRISLSVSASTLNTNGVYCLIQWSCTLYTIKLLTTLMPEDIEVRMAWGHVTLHEISSMTTEVYTINALLTASLCTAPCGFSPELKAKSRGSLKLFPVRFLWSSEKDWKNSITIRYSTSLTTVNIRTTMILLYVWQAGTTAVDYFMVEKIFTVFEGEVCIKRTKYSTS